MRNKVTIEGGKIMYGSLKELESIKTHANAFTPLANSQKQQAQDETLTNNTLNNTESKSTFTRRKQ